MMDKTITLKSVQIGAIAHRLKEGTLLHRLSVSGLLTRELATDMGCQDLIFLENGAPKQGFTKFDLDVECGAFRASFEADPVLKQRFEMTGDSCDSFVVKRTDDGLFLLFWRMNYHGDPHPALAYLEAVGGADSALRIVPLEQKPLFPTASSNGRGGTDRVLVTSMPATVDDMDGESHLEGVDRP